MTIHKHSGDNCHDSCCLRVSGLGVVSDGRAILRDIDLHIHCGQIVAVIGPNGAGKSTLFQAILGQRPHTGSIDFQRSGGEKTRPLIGYVPQSPTFDKGDPVSVLDFFAAAVSRYPTFLPIPKGLRERVSACLRRVHAEGLIGQRLGSLSGGELQRVLLALALEPLPHILILDEPFSGVDVEGELQLLRLLDELRRTFDLSILLSTHDFSNLADYADKVVLMKETVLKVGRPWEVMESPEFAQVFHLRLGKEEAP